ncbi:hypothetical protein BSLA_02f2145 [Burkholderia stabilis]|nr:hypothetical protein BSLA_02f2145 [Burkholderia stabilis]
MHAPRIVLMWFNCRQPNRRYCEPSVIETTECLSSAARYP